MQDMFGNEVKVGDFVVHYNNVYEVLGVREKFCRLVLAEKSKTTRSKSGVYFKDIVLIPKSYLQKE